MCKKCGTRSHTRLVDIGKIGTMFERAFYKALIWLHAYTGCDSVSAFAGKRQTAADIFMELGKDWELTPALMEKLETFTCLLYTSKTSSLKVNELRYHLFCSKKGN